MALRRLWTYPRSRLVAWALFSEARAGRLNGVVMPPRPLNRKVLGLAVAFLLFVPGCVQKSDWVQGTLVTVDVTGVWKGRVTGAGGGVVGIGGEMEMTLNQRGPKVTGDGRIRAEKFSIEGTVRGDVFSFSEAGGRLRAEATVTGDEMAGAGRTNLTGAASATIRFTLSR
jgi:hypothetical protein